MNAEIAVIAPSSTAAEINKFHQLAQERARDTKQMAGEAVVAAWEAGRLLTSERERVRTEQGHGHWEKWLAQNFCGSASTAKRYMRIFKSVTAVTDLPALNLRKAYELLGIVATETEVEDEPRLAPIAKHLIWIQRLTTFLQRSDSEGRVPAAYAQELRHDFAPLLIQMQRLGLQGERVDNEQ